MRDIKKFLANLSHHPGVYQMLDENGVVLYVGKAKNLKNRISSYFNKQGKDLKTLSLVKHIKDIDVTITTNENEAVLLECNLIKQHKPRYNILLRDDKSYPYIFISNHDFPQIDLYRGPRKKNGLYFGPYPSAYAVRETINLLQKLFKLRTCTDSFYESRSRPCLLHQIGRCSGPCVGLISKEEYQHNVDLAILFLEGKGNEIISVLQKKMEAASQEQNYEFAAEYRNQIVRLRQIQDRQYVSVSHGDADVIGYAIDEGVACVHLLSIRHGQILGSRAYFPSIPAHSSEEEIINAFIIQHYLTDNTHLENAPKEIILGLKLSETELIENVLSEQVNHKVSLLTNVRSERKKWLEMATTNAKQSLSLYLFTKTNALERLASLQNALELDALPARIECFDISHIMGEATVASCVVFVNGTPLKSDYRRFNIKDITPGDDVAAMHQVLYRRYRRLQEERINMPDLIFIDGGRTQLQAAKNVLSELGLHEIELIGISKGAGRKPGYETIHRIDKDPLHLPADSQALHLIQQIRDEAHRFAITGHRARRDKTRRKSTLESIPGIGAKRRQQLLRYFGGIQGLARASLDEIKKVPGISHSIAERIFAALHDKIA